MYFVNAPYIGPIVRNALNADKDHVGITKTGPGIEVEHDGVRYFVPWANIKNIRYA